MKRVYAVFSFLLFLGMVFGQYDPKENFYDAEFFFAEEDYPEALYAYTKLYEDGFQDNANINYRIGVCLLNIDDRKTESISFLEKAVLNVDDRYKEGTFNEIHAPFDTYLFLGNAYRINNQFDNAIKSYKKYQEYNLNVASEDLYTKLQIEACEAAKKVFESKGDYKIGTLGQINLIKAPVYNPILSGDLNTFAFMGKQKFYNGIYVSKKQDGKWLRPYNITPSVQSDGNQTVLALSYDGTKMLLSWADQFESEIWISEYRNDRWYPSKPVGKPVNSKYYESNACFSPDGNTIYFTSNRKESVGDMDIFKCTKNQDGTWGALILLETNVNTSLNEENPYVSPDGKRLYFSSQGHPGFGGFDIFYCDINEDGTYGKPVNIGWPLNTTDDDYAFSPKAVNFENYLTLYSKGDENQVDLFRFEWIPEEAQAIQVAFEYTDESELAEEQPVDEVVEEVIEELVEEVAEQVVEPVKEEVDTYTVKPIFFGFDSYALSETANLKLDDLATILSKFTNIELEIIGHTDNVGNQVYNDLLAKKRASAVSNYLKSKGITENRIRILSKGESDPIALNRTPDDRDCPKGRALNRRVQFNTIVPGGVLIKVENIEVPDDLKVN